jgi:hypothetical protein
VFVKTPKSERKRLVAVSLPSLKNILNVEITGVVIRAPPATRQSQLPHRELDTGLVPRILRIRLLQIWCTSAVIPKSKTPRVHRSLSRYLGTYVNTNLHPHVFTNRKPGEIDSYPPAVDVLDICHEQLTQSSSPRSPASTPQHPLTVPSLETQVEESLSLLLRLCHGGLSISADNLHPILDRRCQQEG